ncbi:MAG: penicillin-binding protein activator [Proteobacteria bacterium]|nr:penicillin-binding protein activator [Pseudomonadota bacterium]
MHNRLAYWGVALPVLVAAVCAVAPVVVWGQGAEIRPAAGDMAEARQLSGFEGGEQALRRGNWVEAAQLYTPLVNMGDAFARGQARFGLALALAGLGQEDKALQTLEGTLADDSPLGKAVGELRGHLLLQLADKALGERGPSAAAPWLAQYDRLTVKPNAERYARMRGAGEMPLADGTTANLVLRVGVLLPASGTLVGVGDDILRGMQLGLARFDGRRGVQVELLPMDASDAASAKASAQALVEQRVDVVVGPLLSAAVEAASDILVAAKVPVLALSSDRAVVGGGVHALNYLPVEQGRLAAQAAVREGKTRVAGLVPSTPYGYEVFEGFQSEAERLGATVVASTFYNPQATDIGASIRTLVGLSAAKPKGPVSATVVPFEALFLPAPAATLPLVVAQLNYYDIDRTSVQLLGTALWQDGRILAPSASGVRGGTFAVPPRAEGFAADFSNTFGAEGHPLAVLGFDAARLLVDLGAERQRTGQPIASLLLRPEGFYGSGGFLKFNTNGITQRGLNVVRVGEQFEIVAPALGLAALPLPAELRPAGGRRGFW